MLTSLVALLLTAPPEPSPRDYAAIVSAAGVQFVGYPPSTLDPRNPANNAAVSTEDVHADLDALRPAFDGLVLYGYHEALTPRIVHAAVERDFRAVLFGIWDPKSAAEIDGVIALTEQFGDRLQPAIVVGNEGLYFKRYAAADVEFAAARIRHRLPDVPLATSEPFISFREDQPQAAFVRSFGDFLAPNIHPIFDRPDLGAAEAATWTRETAATLSRETGLSVFLKETGFPHDGKEGFTAESQRTFWRTLLAEGDTVRVDGRVAFLAVGFEAFDLGWKSEASGLEYERSWGLLSPDRTPHDAFNWWQQRAKSKR